MRWLRSLPSMMRVCMRPLRESFGGVRWRVSFFISIALFLVVFLIGAFFFWQGKAALNTALKSKALYIASHLARLTADHIITQDSYELSKQIVPVFTSVAGINSNRDVAYVLFYNDQGALLCGMTASGPISPEPTSSSSGGRDPSSRKWERFLTENERHLSEPAFAYIHQDLYDLVYPVFVSEYKVGSIRVGITKNLLISQFASFVKNAIFALIGVVLLGFAISHIIIANIRKPLLQLSAAAEDLSRQKWKTPIPVKGNDEISRLGQAFNEMALTLQQREASLSQGNRDLLILHAAGLDLMESLEIERLIPKIASRAEDLVRAETVAISVPDDVTRSLLYLGVFGSKAKALTELDMPLEAGGIFNWIASYGTPVLILDAQSDFRLHRDTMILLGIRTIMAVPLWISNSMIGLLTAVNKKGNSVFDKHDLRLFTVYSNLISAAIQNARLYGDLKHNMTQLREAQEQLVHSTKMAAIGELAANVAHEINNPLTSVLGYTTHLLKKVELTPESRKTLEIMEQETLRVRKIIRNLLGFARQRQSCMTPADLLQPLTETIALVQGLAEASSVKILEEYQTAPIIVNMDANEMKQVFINIVNNALQAMPDGGELIVRTHTRNKTEAEVEFLDTGAGITDEHRKKIFEPFFSTKGDRGGTGLGLSISERIVHSHGGRIEVERRVSKGSLFRVVLPLTNGTVRT